MGMNLGLVGKEGWGTFSEWTWSLYCWAGVELEMSVWL